MNLESRLGSCPRIKEVRMYVGASPSRDRQSLHRLQCNSLIVLRLGMSTEIECEMDEDCNFFKFEVYLFPGILRVLD